MRGVTRHISVAVGLVSQPDEVRRHQGVADTGGLVLVSEGGAAEDRLLRELARERGGGHFQMPNLLKLGVSLVEGSR